MIQASRSLGIGESALRRWVGQLLQERTGVTPQRQGADPRVAKDPGAGSPNRPPRTGESDIKKDTALLMTEDLERSR